MLLTVSNVNANDGAPSDVGTVPLYGMVLYVVLFVARSVICNSMLSSAILIILARIGAARHEVLQERRALRDQLVRRQPLIQRDVIDAQRDHAELARVGGGDAGTNVGDLEIAGRIAGRDREAEVARRIPYAYWRVGPLPTLSLKPGSMLPPDTSITTP